MGQVESKHSPMLAVAVSGEAEVLSALQLKERVMPFSRLNIAFQSVPCPERLHFTGVFGSIFRTKNDSAPGLADEQCDITYPAQTDK